tara:strand:- start:539 stop:1864 length:1326 start_codon:yes stop_codon:yes gene_type:complete
MAYIQKITTNIKSPNGGEYTVDLGQHTLLIGENEAGKSGIAEACQLARTGEAYGLLWRPKTVKDGKLLSLLTPTDSTECSATAMLDTGEFCEWKLKLGSRPKHSAPEGSVFTASEIHSVLAGSPETQVKFFAGALGISKASTKDIREEISENLHGFFDIMSADRDTLNLIAFIEKLGKDQREQNNISKAAQIALESLGTVTLVDDEELKGLMSMLQRSMSRDILRSIYLSYRADPTIQASGVINHLTALLGGKESVQRIPLTEESLAEIGEAHFQKRMMKTAKVAKKGFDLAQEKKEAIKRLKDAMVKVLFERLERSPAREEFVARVNTLLSGEQEFLFSVSPGKIEIGLQRDGQEHYALSGSTEARVIAALAGSLSSEDDLIVVDDRMWDSTTLGQTLEVLRNAPGQVIIMSTVRPKGKQRAGWTYVTVERERGEALKIS